MCVLQAVQCCVWEVECRIFFLWPCCGDRLTAALALCWPFRTGVPLNGVLVFHVMYAVLSMLQRMVTDFREQYNSTSLPKF